jgi:hypothetical protein
MEAAAAGPDIMLSMRTLCCWTHGNASAISALGWRAASTEVTVACRSRSKAENVNRGLKELTPGTEYLFVMDADHHPIPIYTMLAILTMETKGYDIVQVRCLTRPCSTASW